MAPVAPKKASSSEPSSSGSGAKRLTARQKAAMRLQNPLIPRKVHRPEAVVSDSFINSKRDKRLIKHSSFVSKITAAKVGKKTLKRRRPSKNLVTTLESLGDALDDIVAQDEKDGNQMMDSEQALQGKIRHNSLKSRPGALKRKEKVVKGEMDRFRRSLAQLARFHAGVKAPAVAEQDKDEDMGVAKTEQTPAAAPSATTDRWAALRGFISATMEQNPAFLAQNQEQKK
ncbi:Ribosome biogenesis protein SLX9 domain containing protein [Naviculisporaceae sp. PSN 640]